MVVELVGPYHGDCYGGHGTHTAACGWTGLTIGAIMEDKPCPYRIDHNGVPIGWAPASSISVPSRVTIGIVIVVR